MHDAVAGTGTGTGTGDAEQYRHDHSQQGRAGAPLPEIVGNGPKEGGERRVGEWRREWQD